MELLLVIVNGSKIVLRVLILTKDSLITVNLSYLLQMKEVLSICWLIQFPPILRHVPHPNYIFLKNNSPSSPYLIQ